MTPHLPGASGQDPGRETLGAVGALRALVAEAVAAIRGQPIASVAALVVVAAMCATVLLTAGRAVGAQQEVIARIDSAATRTITVRASPASGLDTTILDRVRPLGGVTWSGAFSPAVDVRNSAFSGGTAVALRRMWTADTTPLALPPTGGTGTSTAVTSTATSPTVADTGTSAVHASARALSALGMSQGSGGVSDEAGGDYAVVGGLTTPGYLTSLEPLALIAGPPADQAQPVALLVVVASTPDLVAPLRAAVVSLLGVDDPKTVTVSTSEDLTVLRDAVAGQLRTFSRTLVAGVLAATAALVAVFQGAAVVARRKDFGRRRAVGATRGLIIALLLTQTSVLAGIGSLTGAGLALTALAAAGDALPGADFVVAVVVLAIGTSLAATLLPAVIAARRDPLKELRVP